LKRNGECYVIGLTIIKIQAKIRLPFQPTKKNFSLTQIMIFFQPRFCYLPKSLLIVSFLSLLGFIAFQEDSHATSLTSNQIKNLETMGSKAATADHNIKLLKNKLDKGNLSKWQLEKIEKDIRKHESEIQQQEGAARLEGEGSKEGKELFDKSREKHNKDWELLDAEDALKDAEKRGDKKGIKRAKRRIKRIKKEQAILDGEFKALKTKLEAAAQKAKGSSGQPSGKKKTVAQTYKIKGTATTKSGSQVATTKLNLPTLVAGVMVDYRHTAINFVKDEPSTGKSIGDWTKADEEPNPIGTVVGGDVELTVGVKYLFTEELSAKFQYSPEVANNQNAGIEGSEANTTGLSNPFTYTIGVIHGYDATFTQVRYGDLLQQSEYNFGNSEINDNPSNMYGLRDGVSPWGIGKEMEASGLSLKGWTPAALPFGTTLGWQPEGDAGVLDDFVAQHGNAIAYQEANAGTAGAPAPWDPGEWPKTRTQSIPHLQLQKKW